MKKLLYLVPLLLIMGCAVGDTADTEAIVPADWHELGLGSFDIQVPADWKFEQPGGKLGAISGKITGPTATFSFDMSSEGKIDALPMSVEEYLATNKWWKEMFDFPMALADKKIDTTTANEKERFAGADYLARLSYKGKLGYHPIILPEDIKAQNFKVDSNGKYVFKTTWPKVTGKGMTGIYIRARYSSLNFQMSSMDLSQKDQDDALLAFKTIKFKRDEQ